MGVKRRKCENNHRFREHGIGAGLTRKICVLCGLIEIGQGWKVVLVEDDRSELDLSVFASAG